MAQEKDFIGKVADVAGDVANAVVKTTAEIYLKGKLQIETVRLRSDIREQYKLLGEQEYTLLKGKTEDTTERDLTVERLDEQFARLETLEEEAKAEMERREAAREAARVEREQARETVEVRFDSERCPICEQPRIGSFLYCASCGARYPDPPVEPDPVVPEAEPEVVPEAAPEE